MKLESAAGVLTSALSAAELALDNRPVIEALGMVRLIAKDDRVEFVVDALDRRVAASVPVTIIEPGEALARCVSLVGVLAKLRPDQMVRLTRDADNVIVTTGRSCFKIPGLSFDLLPQSPAPVDAITAEFVLATRDLLRLIEATSHAASNEEIRFYLSGIYLHVVKSAEMPTLRSVATDGHRLAQMDLPLPAGAGNMPSIIVPNKTIAVIARLLRRKGVAENVTLRVSDRLFELSLPDLRFTSKLIDQTYPDYARVVPTDYSTSVVVNRDELIAALKRVEAALDPETKQVLRTVAFAWDDGVLHAHRSDVDIDDVIDAKTDGAGKTALQIALAEDALNALAGKRITIAVNGPGTPIRFANPDDPSTFAIVMPVRSPRGT